MSEFDLHRRGPVGTEHLWGSNEEAEAEDGNYEPDMCGQCGGLTPDHPGHYRGCKETDR